MIDFNAPPLKDVLKILLRGLKIDDLAAVKPRAQKSDDEKLSRTRKNAEVFTPAHVVKFMVDALDENIFWQTYIEARWLEVACGEAPFLTNRYDAETGEDIPFRARAGVLDKKLRAIPADADKFTWTFRAVQSVYGYDLQADSLLIARANIFLSFVEFVGDCSAAELAEVADVISRNFWQMDALNPPPAEISLFDDVTDWSNDYFLGGNIMKKFDFAIGNPPYQDETTGDNKTFAPPVYNVIMEAAYKIADKAAFITPARFLFNAGATPKAWNSKMLNDPHLKVLDYAPDARKYFKNVDIEGGVAITLRDETKNFGAIKIFTAFPELNSIHRKVCVDDKNFRPLSEITYSQTIHRLTKKFHEDNPEAVNIISKGHANDFSTVLMKRFSKLFFDDKPDDGHEYIQIHGRVGTERVCKWFRSDWVTHPAPFKKWKVLVPTANGSGSFGEVDNTPLIGTPLISSPLVANTETFITVGAFDTRAEAEACLKYIKSKFARAMLGILKVTQHNTPDKWAKVPLQDFTSGSDIDWSGDVDAQLYRKYGLDAAEINFIEAHVKEMA